MSEKPKNNSAEEAGEIDEIDILIASLPSLQIPDDMVEDSEFVPLRKQERTKTEVTVIFAILAWSFFVFALLTITRAFPSEMAFFNAVTGTPGAASVDTQYILNAVIYLAGNCAVCAGGLGICAIRKKKLTKGDALNFWIAGGASAIIAAVLAIVY